jgi:hypothetical protein
MNEERREELSEELPDIARHTSERSGGRTTPNASRSVEKVRFMADKVGDEFEGYVTGVSAFGLFIELRRALSSRAWCTSRRWRTTTTGSWSARTFCVARRTAASTGSAIASRCR